MVTNNLDEAAVREQADSLSFPSSVVEFFQGAIGIPHGGFPQPLQSQVVKDLPTFTGRPGAELPPLDLDAALAKLRADHGDSIGETDLMSHVMYPKVYEQYKADLDLCADPLEAAREPECPPECLECPQSIVRVPPECPPSALHLPSSQVRRHLEAADARVHRADGARRGDFGRSGEGQDARH